MLTQTSGELRPGGAASQLAADLPPYETQSPARTYYSQTLPRKSTLVLCLTPLTVALCAQPVAKTTPPPAVQIKDVRIPKISRRPQLEEFLAGHSRPDMKRIDDFRQRQPGD